MSRTDKMAYLQLEKAYENVCKARVKMDLIDKNYDTIFPSNEDYQSLKRSYILEEKYAILKCKDIIDNNEKLNEKKKSYQLFSRYYNSKSIVYDLAFIVMPLLIGGIIYSAIANTNLIWLFASLSLVVLGVTGIIFYSSSSQTKEYLGPNSMQIKVLKRIDQLVISGTIYEEIIKDCQLQFAKRRLIEKEKNQTYTNPIDLEKTSAYQAIKDDNPDYVYSFSSLSNIKNVICINDTPIKEEKQTTKTVKSKKASESIVYAKYVSSKAKTTKKASVSPTYAKYMTSNDTTLSSKFTSKKTVVANNSTITRVSLDINSPKKTRKKASESSIYAKYMQNKQTTKSTKPTSKKTVVARYSGNSTITKVALDMNSPKKTKKKASESSIYAKYMKDKQTKKEVKQTV